MTAGPCPSLLGVERGAVGDLMGEGREEGGREGGKTVQDIKDYVCNKPPNHLSVAKT